MSKKEKTFGTQLSLDFEKKIESPERFETKLSGTNCASTKVVFFDSRRDIYQRILNRVNK